MNMANSDYQEQNFDYQADFGRRPAKDKSPRERRFQYSRSNRPAVSHNGIHRRRNKRFCW
jgi:hypothetical protein